MSNRKNIVWITLDSLRYHNTSFSTGGQETTPNLRRIATHDRGQSFDYCFSHSIATYASATSILTGTYLSRHGVGGPFCEGDMYNEVVPPELDTVGELLSEIGYQTSCISTNAHVSPAYGLDRGFDDYTLIDKETFLPPSNFLATFSFLRTLRRYSAGFTLNRRKHSKAYFLTELAKRKLSTLSSNDEPFFMYLHYNQPHYPYYPPIAFRDRFLEECELSVEETLDLSMRVFGDIDSRTNTIEEGSLTDEELSALEALYNAEIAFTDYCIGQLFDFIQENVPDETVVVLTSDHGELFGEQGLIGHELLVTDELCHVPLVVYGFDEINHHETNFVQHTDLVKTLLADNGARTNSIQGDDLREEVRDSVILERAHADVLTKHSDKFMDSFHRPFVSALRTEDLKYVQSNDGEELYELPNEQTDVIDEYPDDSNELRMRLESWKNGTKQMSITETSAEVSGSVRQQLADMGYID